MRRFPRFPVCLAGETPCERRLLRIRAAYGARHVVVMSGVDAYVTAVAHSDAIAPAGFEELTPSVSEGGSGCYVSGLFPVLFRILRSSLDAHRGLKRRDGNI